MSRLITRIAWLALALGLAGAGACAAAEAAKRAEVPVLPAIVEGRLLVEVAADEVDQDDGERLNFGTLSTGDGEISFQVDSAVLDAAGIPAEGAPVRATLGARSDEFGFPLYTITALTRLP